MKKWLLLFVITSGLMMTSCYTEPERGVAKITVYYQAFRQDGVTVHLYGPPGSHIDRSFLTDLNGEVIYEHDPALEVILNVDLDWVDPGMVAHHAAGMIRITPDKITDESFNLP
jgi:hypothetical protein